MKNLALALVIVGSTMLGSYSHALVRLVTTCQTHDNLYRITILDNQGIGPVRTSHFGATIYTANNVVLAHYAVKSNDGEMKSASFGQSIFKDIQTNGNKFLLAFGSTNFRHTTLKAVLNNGVRISELDPVCRSLARN